MASVTIQGEISWESEDIPLLLHAYNCSSYSHRVVWVG